MVFSVAILLIISIIIDAPVVFVVIVVVSKYDILDIFL